jgi:very-short-patch-repair endonuclease
MIHGPKETQRKAAALRKTMSLPEVLLWKELRQRPDGLKFRRQHPAGRYILDFFCTEAKLAIEVDGRVHDMGDRPATDTARRLWLENQGIRVLRIAATRILANPAATAEAIARYARQPILP